MLDPLSIARRCIQYSSTFSQCSGSFESVSIQSSKGTFAAIDSPETKEQKHCSTRSTKLFRQIGKPSYNATPVRRCELSYFSVVDIGRRYNTAQHHRNERS